MHRTTILLDTDLERRLKQHARRVGTTFTALVRTFIQEGLNRVGMRSKTTAAKLPKFSMGVSQIDPADRERLWDFMDQA